MYVLQNPRKWQKQSGNLLMGHPVQFPVFYFSSHTIYLDVLICFYSLYSLQRNLNNSFNIQTMKKKHDTWAHKHHYSELLTAPCTMHGGVAGKDGGRWTMTRPSKPRPIALAPGGCRYHHSLQLWIDQYRWCTLHSIVPLYEWTLRNIKTLFKNLCNHTATLCLHQIHCKFFTYNT